MMIEYNLKKQIQNMDKRISLFQIHLRREQWQVALSLVYSLLMVLASLFITLQLMPTGL